MKLIKELANVYDYERVERIEIKTYLFFDVNRGKKILQQSGQPTWTTLGSLGFNQLNI